MKKILSLFVLCNIFLSSFFAQEVHAAIWEGISIVHTTGSKSNNHHHKTPVFSEFSNESEDSIEKTNLDIQFGNYYNQHVQHKFAPDILRIFYSIQLIVPDYKNSLPLFIKNSSFLI
jgi:hypothetical protein